MKSTVSRLLTVVERELAYNSCSGINSNAHAYCRKREEDGRDNHKGSIGRNLVGITDHSRRWVHGKHDSIFDGHDFGMIRQALLNTRDNSLERKVEEKKAT